MPLDVESVVEISRPRSVVAAFAADPDNATTWYDNIKQVRWKTAPPLGIGTEVEFVAHFLGRTLVYTYEVVELQPDERCVMRTAQGPFPMETTYSWIDTADGGTRMSLRNRGAPTGFGHVAGPLMALAMRRANRKDLVLLKATLEGSIGTD